MVFLKNLAGPSALGPGSCGGGSCLFPWSTIPPTSPHPPSPIHPGPKPWGPPWCLVFSHPTSHPWANPACSSCRIQPPPDHVLTSSALVSLPWTRPVTPPWAPALGPHPCLFSIRHQRNPVKSESLLCAGPSRASCPTWLQPGIVEALWAF